MASSGGHNFVDYTMHSCKRSILGTGQGIVCILIMGYCHSFYRLLWKKKKKKYSSPRRDEVLFSPGSGSSSHIMRATQHVIIEQQFITHFKIDRWERREIFLLSLPPTQSFFFVQRQLEIWLRKDCYFDYCFEDNAITRSGKKFVKKKS